MSGFVVCPSCGARIKAGRGHCLRCFEALPVDGVEEVQPWYRSLQLSQGTTLIVGVALTLGALLLSALIWERATPEVDDVARPVASSAKTPAARTPGRGPAVDAPPSPVRAPILEPGFMAAPAVPGATAGTVDFDAARAAHEQALAKRPDDPDILNKLGEALVGLGKLDEAIPRFERAAALAPNRWTYHFNLAHAASQLLLWDRAVEEYRRAAALSPTDFATQFDLALALHKKGDDNAAVTEFEKANKLSPRDAKVQVVLAMSLEKIGRIPEAVRAYQRFLEIEPGAPDAEKVKAHIESLESAQPPARP
jgi:tetratricopeptide (TPR) repeat protein